MKCFKYGSKVVLDHLLAQNRNVPKGSGTICSIKYEGDEIVYGVEWEHEVHYCKAFEIDLAEEESMKSNENNKKVELLTHLCKVFGFNGLDDTQSRVNGENRDAIFVALNIMKEDIISSFRKPFTVKLRDPYLTSKGCFTVLRQLLRSEGKYLISTRKYRYDKNTKRTKLCSIYFIR